MQKTTTQHVTTTKGRMKKYDNPPTFINEPHIMNAWEKSNTLGFVPHPNLRMAVQPGSQVGCVPRTISGTSGKHDVCAFTCITRLPLGRQIVGCETGRWCGPLTPF